jgi:hypothetical protein
MDSCRLPNLALLDGMSWGRANMAIQTRLPPISTLEEARHERLIHDLCLQNQRTFLESHTKLPFDRYGAVEPMLQKRSTELESPTIGAHVGSTPATGPPVHGHRRQRLTTDGAFTSGIIIGGRDAPLTARLPPLALPAAKRDNDIFGRRGEESAQAAPPVSARQSGVSHRWSERRWAQGGR